AVPFCAHSAGGYLCRCAFGGIAHQAIADGGAGGAGGGVGPSRPSWGGGLGWCPFFFCCCALFRGVSLYKRGWTGERRGLPLIVPRLQQRKSATRSAGTSRKGFASEVSACLARCG